MKTPDFIIVADRGIVKAFHVETPGGREPIPRLLDTMEIEEAHGRYQDKYTDAAGAFPNLGKGGDPSGAAGFREGQSHAERMDLAAENEVRCFRRIAGHIGELLQEHKPARWAFAAPSEINGAIVDHLEREARESLAMNVDKDLAKIPVAKLLSHFDGA